MLRIAICDDLKSERDMVKGFLRSFFAAVPYEYTLAEYSRGETMVDDYDDGSVDFDLIFMDIFMDGMLGMEAARCLRRYAPHVSIVFLTTTPAYAWRAMMCMPTDTLSNLGRGKNGSPAQAFFLQEEYEGNQKTLLLKKGCRGRRIAYREIEYIESRRNVLLVFLENGEEYRVYAKLDDVEKELKGHGFLRCHQSFIVNMNRVRVAEDDFLMMSGAHIPIRQRGSRAIRDAYFGYLLERAELTRI